jgi:hypothetical protein
LVTKGEFTPVLKNSKAAAFDHKAQKVRLGGHRIFQPLPTDPLDFESTIEKTPLERFYLREVRYDPYQKSQASKTEQRKNVVGGAQNRAHLQPDRLH